MNSRKSFQGSIGQILNLVKLDDYMHRFKGSSSSIGAKKAKEMLIVQEMLLCWKHREMHQDFSTTQARACHFKEEARNILSGLCVSVNCK